MLRALMRWVVRFLALVLVLIGFITVDASGERAALVDAFGEATVQAFAGTSPGKHDEQPHEAQAPCEAEDDTSDEDETDDDADDADADAADEAFVSTSRGFERRVGNVHRWRLAPHTLGYACPAVEPATRPPRA